MDDGHYPEVWPILRAHHVSEATLTGLAGRLREPAPAAKLAEPFLRAAMIGCPLVLVAGNLLAADPAPKDTVTAVAKKLADQANYSLKTTFVVPQRSTSGVLPASESRASPALL